MINEEQARNSWRIFIALPLPPEISSEIAKLSSNLQKGFRFTGCHPSWVERENYHLTLRFLGQTEEPRVEQISESLSKIARAHGPIRLRAAGLGVFPSWRKPRVLWTGLKEAGTVLYRLQSDTEMLARELNFEPEEKPFHPHVTLARIRSLKGIEAARKIAASHDNFTTDLFLAEKLVLMRSDPTPQGVRYTPVSEYELAHP